MTFTLVIELENDAFQPEPIPEVTRLLRRVADRLELGDSSWSQILDLNGNRVGSWSLR